MLRNLFKFLAPIVGLTCLRHFKFFFSSFTSSCMRFCMLMEYNHIQYDCNYFLCSGCIPCSLFVPIYRFFIGFIQVVIGFIQVTICFIYVFICFCTFCHRFYISFILVFTGFVQVFIRSVQFFIGFAQVFTCFI